MSGQRIPVAGRDGTPLCHTCGELMEYLGEIRGWEYWHCQACGCTAGFPVAALRQDEPAHRPRAGAGAKEDGE